MARVAVTPEVLQWARRRRGLTTWDLARRLRLREERVVDWEAGQGAPTFRQARELARVLQIPLGYLFLPHPPKIELPVADFRTLPEAGAGEFSPDLQEVLFDALRKQDWYRERRIQEGLPPLDFIGRVRVGEDVRRTAEEIRRTLDWAPEEGDRDALGRLVRKAEEAGILVLQSGVVGNNPHRPLSVQEFRGFALADPYAPLIFLNAQDARVARFFTLAHELVHLWTGTSGISNPDLRVLDAVEPGRIERYCNRVAAEVLVPTDRFLAVWDRGQDPLQQAEEVARRFQVSRLVALIRARELGVLPEGAFREAFAEAKKRGMERQRGRETTGGNFYRTLLTRNSRRFVEEVLRALREGQILYREAGRLLNVQPEVLDRLMQELGR